MRKFLLKLITNFPFGVFVGVEGTLILIFFFSRQDFEKVTMLPAYLFAASATLLASSVAVAGVLATLQQNEMNRLHERQRRLASARAFLPSSLSRFCRIAHVGCSLVHQVYRSKDRTKELGVIEPRMIELALQDEIVQVFRDVLEFVEDEQVSSRIQLILKEYQVQFARTQSMLRDSTVGQDDYLRQLAVGWAYVYGLVVTLFNYARGDCATVNDDAFSLGAGLSDAGVFVTDEYEDEIDLYARTFQRRKNSSA